MSTRYGMVIDLDRCNGCGACMLACAAENNVPPAQPEATERTGLTWMRVYRVNANNRTAYVPMLCQQCGRHTPCASVCPQNAVESDSATGIVDQMPQRCLGCRYCMAACPYHARYFNWWDPVWPDGMERTLNPEVSPRMRGVVEKCNFCHGRYHAAKAKAAVRGSRAIDAADYVPACVESCPMGAIAFGDLNDPGSEVAQASRAQEAFRLLERLGTEPKIYYRSKQDWIRRSVHTARFVQIKEAQRG